MRCTTTAIETERWSTPIVSRSLIARVEGSRRSGLR
jgi:hypothetical protein